MKNGDWGHMQGPYVRYGRLYPGEIYYLQQYYPWQARLYRCLALEFFTICARAKTKSTPRGAFLLDNITVFITYII